MFARVLAVMNNTSGDKSPRCLLRFSLRTFLLIILLSTVPMVWLGWKLERTRQQRQVVEWVQKRGGTALHAHAGASRLAPRWLRNCLGDDFFRRLDYVELPNMAVDDLTPLAEMTEMRSIDLYYAPVSDLRPLARMTNMRDLYIRETNVSDVTPLASMTKLETLDLTGTAVSDLTPLAGMTRMRKLYLNHTPVSDVSPLTEMKDVTIFLDESQQVIIPNELRKRVKRIRVTVTKTQ